MNILTKIAVSALGLFIAAYLVPGIEVDSLTVALVSAIILGILNLIVRPILILFTLPITIITLGLFVFILNAFLFWFAASFIDGFTVAGFLPALIGSVIVSVVSMVGNKLLHEK